jgi:hypothetical protein
MQSVDVSPPKLGTGLHPLRFPHHGPINAYLSDIWTDWLNDDCVNLLAPFRSKRLPRPEMVRTMKSHGLPLWATANDCPTVRASTGEASSIQGQGRCRQH